MSKLIFVILLATAVGFFVARVFQRKKSNVVVEKINKLGRSEKTKYNKYTKEKNDELAKALTFFEKAYVINSKDEATLEALKEVYYKLGKYDDAKRIMSELSEL